MRLLLVLGAIAGCARSPKPMAPTWPRSLDTILGVVVDTRGVPVAGATVLAHIPGTYAPAYAVADDAGRFRLSGLRPDVPYSFEVRGRWFMPMRPAASFPEIRLPTGRDLRLTVRPSDGTIRGRLVDARGNAMPRVLIRASYQATEPRLPLPSPSTALTDASGAFTIEDLPDALFAISVSDGPLRVTLMRNVAAGARGVVLRVDDPGEIDVTVSGFSEAVDVTVDPGLRRLTQRTSTSARFLDIPPGRHRVEAQTTSEFATAWVDVKSRAVSFVTLTSIGTASLAGRALSFPEGKPIEGLLCGASIRFEGQAVALFGASRSNADGSFAVPRAPAGDVAVVCLHRDGLGSWPVGESRVLHLSQGASARVDVLVANPDPPKGRIGVRFAEGTTRVIEVAPSSPASRAIRPGDVLLAVDGVSVENAPLLAAGLITKHLPRQTVRLDLRRGTERLTLEIVVAPAAWF